MKLAGRNRSADPVGLKHRPQVLQRRLDAVGHLDRVRRILLRHDENHPWLALNGRSADRGFRRLHHVGDIAQRDARRSLAQQHGPCDVVGGKGLPLGLKHDPLVFGVDEASAADPGRPAGHGQDIVEGHVVADELIGVDLHLNRPSVAAEHRDFSDAGNSQQPRTDRPLGNRTQIHQRSRLRREARHQHRAR